MKRWPGSLLSLLADDGPLPNINDLKPDFSQGLGYGLLTFIGIILLIAIFWIWLPRAKQQLEDEKLKASEERANAKAATEAAIQDRRERTASDREYQSKVVTLMEERGRVETRYTESMETLVDVVQEMKHMNAETHSHVKDTNAKVNELRQQMNSLHEKLKCKG